MRIIDRYVIRQVLVPYLLGLLVFTFLLMLRSLQDYAEELISKGVPGPTIVWLLATLIPQALALTIPMSLLLGLLVGFGRLSADREFVAMQACGVGLKRLLLPVGLISGVSMAATAFMWFYGYPIANQIFREVTFNVVADRAEGTVRPHVFFRDFPNLMLYVRDVPVTGEGWNGVFMSDSRRQPESTYVARHGRIVVNRQQKTVDVVLDDVVRHTVDTKGVYDVARFNRLLLSLDPTTMFPPPDAVIKGVNEMTLWELMARAAELEGRNVSSHNEWIAIHRKFAIPIACLVFGVIGLTLGATHRRDGALGSFVLGLAVVFAYYVPLYLGPQLTKGNLMPPWLAAWLPNIVLGAMAVALFVWRDRVADQPIRLPAFIQRRLTKPKVARVRPQRFLRILDGYVTGMYVRILLLSASALLAVFYISTFIDRADKLFKGTASLSMMGQYFWYLTPQYLYYVIPLAVLLGTLVTIAVLTKNSELVVMKACGISLYRIATPMLVCAVAAGGVLFLLDQTIVGPYFEKAERLRMTMNGNPNAVLNPLSYGWIQGTGGDFYFFRSYDPAAHHLVGVDRYEFNQDMTRIVRRVHAEEALYAGRGDGGTEWAINQGWARDFDDQGKVSFVPLAMTTRRFEPPAYFGTEQPDPQFMRFADLRQYTARMIASGYNMFAQQVWIARRAAFPFVTLIMTLIAVPFAVTIGRGGAMAGIGVGIGLALVYWVSISLFAALGGGGRIDPTLAAWAPNMLFGAGALYLLLTVRT